MATKKNLPDFKEFVGYAGKLMRDIKSSVCEIVDQYQSSRKAEADVKSSESKACDPKKETTTTKTRKKNVDKTEPK